MKCRDTGTAQVRAQELQGVCALKAADVPTSLQKYLKQVTTLVLPVTTAKRAL